MNGLISRASIRFTLAVSTCLLTGFVTGANYHSLNSFSLFSTTEINYSKINWISGTFSPKNISLATIDYPASELQNQEIKVAEFHLPLPAAHPLRIALHQHHEKVHSNFQLLSSVVEKIKEVNSYDPYRDYQVASTKMKDRFLYVMNFPVSVPQSVTIAASSAKVNLDEPIIPIQTAKTEKLHKTTRAKLNTRKLNTQRYVPTVSEVLAEVKQEKEDHPVNVATNPEPVISQKVQITAPVTQANVPILSTQEKSAVQEQLLNEHIQNYVLLKEAPKETTPDYAANVSPQKVFKVPEEEVDHNNDVDQPIAPELVTPEPTIPKNTCDLLPQLHLMKPVSNQISETTQVCPTQKDWISKSWNEHGWVKVTTDSYFPFLTHYPQSNTSDALLLDQNSVALLAIKSGIHYAHGMGMVLGILPTGYKIEFSGRSEEVQYFDLNDKKYFIIMNVEPGAGVTELISDKDQNENATVFTPVLGDTITYLDLVAPVVRNIAVKVTKDIDSKDKTGDLAGLTVGLSTQTQVQAITQADGSAFLRNVRVVPGYPMFVDVSSKLNGEKSYQYRYELKKRNKSGVFVLRQYPEKEIFQWLRQIKASISDQSGMIFGEFNRKRLDGFKKNYTVRIESMTEKFGLVAKNYTVLWNEKLSEQDPLEGDRPRYLSVQVPEGLAQSHLVNENNQIIQSSLIPVSPRIINVISE